MKYPLILTRFILVICFVLMSFSAYAQNCSTGAEVTAPAGGTVSAATSLTVYNSTEAGSNSAATRTAVDAQDDAWRTGATAANLGNSFFTVTDTVTAQSTVNVPRTNIFNIFGLNISYDYRDFPLDYRTTARPCIGSQIATASERVTFLSKDNAMQTAQSAPRPASLYNPNNQPLVYDEIEAANQPNRINTANAVLFTFSTPVKAFGAWFGDIESRTANGGGGVPALVRFLDASGNRIGSDVLIQPMTGSQSGCGDSNSGCGNQSTRWIGFTDTNAAARVKQMVVVVGYQGGNNSSWGDQRISFIGPTVPVTTTAAEVPVSGRVMNGKSGVRNARVMLRSFDGVDSRFAVTNSFGYYRFTDIPAGTTYLISVSSKGLTFAPDTQVFTLLDELVNLDFTAQDQ